MTPATPHPGEQGQGAQVEYRQGLPSVEDVCGEISKTRALLAAPAPAAQPLPVVPAPGGDLTTDATWSPLAAAIARGIVASWEKHDTAWDARYEVQGVGAVMANLTGADLLSIVADCVARLPHGPGTPGPGLELGESAEAYELIRGILHGGAVGGLRLPMNGRDLDYVSVCINGLWIGASMPKTEGK